jgi:hypothetical protein
MMKDDEHQQVLQYYSCIIVYTGAKNSDEPNQPTFSSNNTQNKQKDALNGGGKFSKN